MLGELVSFTWFSAFGFGGWSVELDHVHQLGTLNPRPERNCKESIGGDG